MTSRRRRAVRRLIDETTGPVRNSVILTRRRARPSTTRSGHPRGRSARLRAARPLRRLRGSSGPGRRWIAMWRAIGEDQRICSAMPSEFAIFGEHAVVGRRDLGRPGPTTSSSATRCSSAFIALLRPACGPRATRAPAGACRPTAGRPAARPAGPRAEGRGHRPLPRLEPAHGTPPGGPPDGGARRRHPLPARRARPSAGRLTSDHAATQRLPHDQGSGPARAVGLPERSG